MSLSRVLPAPIQKPYDREDEELEKQNQAQITAVLQNTAPPYGHRSGWIPRTQQDFGDGGAYPECIVAQYPLRMGLSKSTSNALQVALDSTGKIKYDAIARQGQASDKIIHANFSDLVPKRMENDDPELEKPDEESIQALTEATRAALGSLASKKVDAAMPVKRAEKVGPTQYIRYTPAQQGSAFNSGAKQRIIRMVETQVDPMEPPKFKTNKKIPRGPPSPPAPVLHSPNRKVSVKEQQDWKIPPCISNWKNSKGYTIPLDKRLAADGRGLQGVHMNENFSKLSEALYIADRKARQAVEVRAQIEKKVAQKEKEKKEDSLRTLAQRAREERAGIRREETEKGDEDVKERDDLRRDRNKERQRERNIARAAPDKRNRLQKERERDISEQIALGKPAQSHNSNPETIFDQRLFNQSKGISSGFNDEDDMYDVYDKPWRGDKNVAQHLYRPTKDKTDTTGRSGPVQFERDAEDDPFGLNRFLSQVRGDKNTSATEKRAEKPTSSENDDGPSRKKKSKKH